MSEPVVDPSIEEVETYLISKAWAECTDPKKGSFESFAAGWRSQFNASRPALDSARAAVTTYFGAFLPDTLRQRMRDLKDRLGL